MQYLFVNKFENKILCILLSFVFLVQWKYLPYQLNSGTACLRAGILALLQRGGFEKEGSNSLEIMVFPFALEIYIF